MYLAEAHAADSWPLSAEARTTHSCLSQRLEAAESFLAEYPGLASLVDEVFVDSMDDKTTIDNGLWPERYVLLEGQSVLWASSLRFEDRGADVPRLIRDTALSLW